MRSTSCGVPRQAEQVEDIGPACIDIVVPRREVGCQLQLVCNTIRMCRRRQETHPTVSALPVQRWVVEVAAGCGVVSNTSAVAIRMCRGLPIPQRRYGAGEARTEGTTKSAGDSTRAQAHHHRALVVADQRDNTRVCLRCHLMGNQYTTVKVGLLHVQVTSKCHGAWCLSRLRCQSRRLFLRTGTGSLVQQEALTREILTRPSRALLGPTPSHQSRRHLPAVELTAVKT